MDSAANSQSRPLSPAQRRVLNVLKQDGTVTVAQIATRLEMSDVAARQHLAALLDHGMVSSTTEAPRKRGRPATLWSLTERAASAFPDSHAELTVGLISAVRRAVGDEGLLRVLDERANDQVEAYRASMPAASSSLKRRVEALARIRSAEGYMAEVESGSGHVFYLIENHCPICEAAHHCVGLCSTELDVFQRVLGADVHVERTEHLLNDDRRCVYRIERKERPAKT